MRAKVHRLIRMHVPPKHMVLTNRETAIQGHSRSSVVVSIDSKTSIKLIVLYHTKGHVDV